MSLGMPKTAFFYGALGVASDFIDGPMARWKNPKTGRDDVTGLGTILDHFRDFYYAISIGLDAFFRFGNINAVEITNAILILISYIIIITGVIFKYQLLNLNYISPIFKKYSRARVKNAYRRFMDFSYMNLQTKLWGRAQFICLATGLTMLFLGKFMGINFLIGFSVDFFGATIAFGSWLTGPPPILPEKKLRLVMRLLMKAGRTIWDGKRYINFFPCSQQGILCLSIRQKTKDATKK